MRLLRSAKAFWERSGAESRKLCLNLHLEFIKQLKTNLTGQKCLQKMNRHIRTFLAAAAVLCCLATPGAKAQSSSPTPKREFRGAWIQTVNGQYMGMDRDRMQRTLTSYLDAFKRCGLNTVMFQVRCEDECLKRRMELHAWINPYRAKTAAKHEMALNHPYNMYPDHFFKYGDLILFDPGEPYNREYICRVVSDIMRRYDVDGIHMMTISIPTQADKK